jgi:hypothetical protein
MSSLVWLGLAAILVGIVALTRTAPKHGKPVQNTRLMAMARYVLVLGIIACAGLGIFGALGR